MLSNFHLDSVAGNGNARNDGSAWQKNRFPRSKALAAVPVASRQAFAMSERWAIVGVGATLAGLILAVAFYLSGRIDAQGAALRAAIDAQGAELRAVVRDVARDVARLDREHGERLARLESTGG